MAELWRVRAAVVLSGEHPDSAEALLSLDQALSVAKEQGAKLWELRAAVDLARLWMDLDRCDDAYEMLRGVYGWFTEGFDTADLRSARALLSRLENRRITPESGVARRSQ